MRMLLTAHIPAEPFNTLAREGKAGQIISAILSELKPEAAYFTEEHGKRCAILVVNVSDPSRVPTFAEPFFLKFNAECRFRVAMTPDDLGKAGLDELGRKWR